MTPVEEKTVYEYQKLKKQIVSQIHNKKLKPGDKLPSLRTMASRCGLSLAPIRQAIQELDAEGYIVRYHGKGIFVNSKARTAQHDIQEIALVVPGIDTNESFAKMAQHMQGYCRKSGYREIVLSTENHTNEAEIIEKLPELGMSGAVIFPSEKTLITKMLKRLRQQKFPFAMINTIQPMVPAPCVTPNNFLAGYMATVHLTDLGHKKIGIVAQRKNFEFNNPQYQGYLQALQKAGIKPEPSFVATPSKTLNIPAELINWGQVAAEQLLEANPDITAVISTPTVAAGICKVILPTGRKIPDDFSLVSIGTSVSYLMAINIPPDVTAIEMNELKVVAKAVDIVTKEIEQGIGHADCLQLPCEFVPGMTTAKVNPVFPK